MANSLTRLLPNIGGASGRVRRLYVATVHSVLLYAAPVWSDKVGRNAHLGRQLAAAQRLIANRAARAYQTVSHVGATTLAGIPPIHLISRSHARVYEQTREIREGGGPVDWARVKRMLRLQAKAALLCEWEEYLANPQLGGRRVREAIQSILGEWVERKGRGLTFHAAQVITGHGCFVDYLCRIGKERTTRCHHCPEEADTAQHTLEFCPAWEEQRRVLRASVGKNLSFPAIMATVAGVGAQAKAKWEAFISFCGTVMLQKMIAEKIRRWKPPLPTTAGGATGRRGRARDLSLRYGDGDVVEPETALPSLPRLTSGTIHENTGGGRAPLR
ncbi:uncharacterized protein [Temnothorax nylanderi]|uniref:uncharacterized protein n=1 Tax=Temnothorax nylanderi TaxID=102681 RepID=UPI003A88B0BB